MINATSSFQSKAFEKQFTINTKVLCLLRRGESKEAMRVLTERNAVLKLADKDPRVLQLVDAREATQELEALAKPLSKDVRDLISSERDGRKRRFLGASNFNARGFAGSAYQGPYGQARRSMPRLLDLNVQTPRGCCYSCQGFGHFANRCPEKKFNSKRQYCHWGYWKSIGASDYILNVIEYGYKLPFNSATHEPKFCMPNTPMVPNDCEFVSSEIRKLIETEAVLEVLVKPQVMSSLFVVRNTGKPRMIINLKRLNKSQICPKFKYEDLDLVSRWVVPNGWLAKFDMKSGYHHIGPKGSIYTKNIYRSICAFAFLDGGVPLMSEERKELNVLENILRNPMKKSLYPPSKIFSFASDASAFALGVVSKTGESFSRPLTFEERKRSRSQIEMDGL
uniref:CCHC-type domain-containing protein n=1 Tax=Panagrolaimus superbus TaxID=310955 RepID=A0A914YNJ1_9BILA